MAERGKQALRLRERTAASFGFEWSRFPDMYAAYESNFLSYIWPVDREAFKGKNILDAGCGAGRHSHYAAHYGAQVTAFDASPGAVEATARNLVGHKHATAVQADIYNLPTAWHGAYDYIMCIGVLHHLPDPQQGFNELVKCLRPGGAISIWVYGMLDNQLALRLYEPVRRITTRLPHKLLYRLAWLPAGLLHLAHRCRLPMFRHYRRFPFRTKWNDAFDVFAAPKSRYYTPLEIEVWFRQAGLHNIQVSYRMLDGKAKGIRGYGIR